jgi:hypothetical protein
MTVEQTRVSTAWLDLREPADAAARDPGLAGLVRRRLRAGEPGLVHDLACGTGAMGRWLAPLLPGPQRWVLHDRDPDLLEVAASAVPGPALDGSPVSVETRRCDITGLEADDLAGATLITASALLDLLTGEELLALARICASAGCPVLLTLSVTGRVHLGPEHPLDARIAAAFDDHQRRMTGRGRLLGPDAAAAAVEAFQGLGMQVVVRPSPWRLGRTEAGLAAEWFAGWLAAACEQDPHLPAAVDGYRRRRLAEARAGELFLTVDHADLLVLP